MRTISALLLLGVLLTGAFAQRPRTMDRSSKGCGDARAEDRQSQIRRRRIWIYEDDGRHFDLRRRQQPFDLQRQEAAEGNLDIPYEAITSAFADTQKRQPAAATVASHIPSSTRCPRRFIKTKVRYLTLQYSDPDSKVTRNDELQAREQGDTRVVSGDTCRKAGMTQRGDIYVKKRETIRAKQTRSNLDYSGTECRKLHRIRNKLRCASVRHLFLSLIFVTVKLYSCTNISDRQSFRL